MSGRLCRGRLSNRRKHISLSSLVVCANPAARVAGHSLCASDQIETCYLATAAAAAAAAAERRDQTLLTLGVCPLTLSPQGSLSPAESGRLRASACLLE